MKRIFSSLTRGVLILLFLGCVALWTSTGDFIVSLKPAQNFEDVLNNGAEEGQHIEGNVVYAYDCFASEETWKENRNGSRTPAKTSSYYYAIPGGENLLGIKVKTDLSSSMEKLADETFTLLTGGSEPTTQIAFEGRVLKMESELAEYFNEYLEEIGYTQDEINAMGTPLVIEQRSFGSVRVIFLIGVILILLAVFFFFRAFKRNAPSKESADGGQAYNVQPPTGTDGTGASAN